MTVSIQNNLLRRFFRGRNSAEKQFLAGAISPLVLYMTFWTIFPLLWGIALAFFDYSPRQTGGFLGFGEGNPFVGLQHFESMLNFTADAPLEVQQFHIGIRVTLLFAVLVVPLNLLVTLPLAFLIESINDKVKGIFRTLFFLPVLAPSVGVAIMWGFIFHPQRGLLNAIIGEFTGKLVGVDTANVDHPNDSDFPAHHTLLRAGVPIVENVVNLADLRVSTFTFVALPLRLRGASGSPIRAVALV